MQSTTFISKIISKPSAFRNGSTAATKATTFFSKDLSVTHTTAPKPKVPLQELVFGKTFSDHMLQMPWTQEAGWGAPAITPYGKLELDPSCTVFHYAIECFEGMKAYRDQKGAIRLFRPDKNAQRLLNSSQRLSLPTFSEKEFIECLKEFCKVEKEWIPSEHGYSLYIRPTHISTDKTLGVAPAKSSLLYVISCPVGPYYKEGFAPVKLFADSKHVRAWPGGTGHSKLGSNYAPTIFAQQEAAQKGFSQVLWTIGPDHEVAEVGTMNFMMLWTNENGEKELVTPPLDGTILPGVTRDSILELCRGWGEFKVSERKFTMHDVARAVKEKRIVEAFGCGTAAIVSPIKLVHFGGEDLNIPIDPALGAGKLTKRIADTIMAIQYGEVPHEWSVVIN